VACIFQLFPRESRTVWVEKSERCIVFGVPVLMCEKQLRASFTKRTVLNVLLIIRSFVNMLFRQ